MEYLIFLIGAILFLLGAIFGFDSLYVIVPFIISISMLIWYFAKGPDGKRNPNIIWQFSVIATIFAFIAVGFGSCVSGCTRGGGDTTQQRIEMGIPLY